MTDEYDDSYETATRKYMDEVHAKVARIENPNPQMDETMSAPEFDITTESFPPTDPDNITIHGGWYIAAGVVLCGFLWFVMDYQGWLG